MESFLKKKKKATMPTFLEKSIDEILLDYSTGTLKCSDVIQSILKLIDKYDHNGLKLNSVVVLNPNALYAAEESDKRWASNCPRPLEGIPFTVKDSYAVKGLTIAAGSKAFSPFISKHSAHAVEKLIEAGAILIGKTNMPPMARGGMQYGVYGTSLSPYNTQILPAAFASGSSHGSAVATTMNFGMFSLAGETVSSGRSPASNNSICTYTPSWGLISTRGVWPLFPIRDVVTTFAKNMSDLLKVTKVISSFDDREIGDFWRQQRYVEIPKIDFNYALLNEEIIKHPTLEGRRFIIPKQYINKNREYDITLNPALHKIWDQTMRELEELGAEILEAHWPLITFYESDPCSVSEQFLNVMPKGWLDTEFETLLTNGWAQFLNYTTDDTALIASSINPNDILPDSNNRLPDRYPSGSRNSKRYEMILKNISQGNYNISNVEHEAIERGIKSLIQMREKYYHSWLEDLGADGLVFPANGDVASVEAYTNPLEADKAWSNGVLFSNGNYIIRQFGIPTVTLPMGSFKNIDFPIGVTITAKAGKDLELLRWGYAYNNAFNHRKPPPILIHHAS